MGSFESRGDTMIKIDYRSQMEAMRSHATRRAVPAHVLLLTSKLRTPLSSHSATSMPKLQVFLTGMATQFLAHTNLMGVLSMTGFSHQHTIYLHELSTRTVRSNAAEKHDIDSNKSVALQRSRNSRNLSTSMSN